MVEDDDSTFSDARAELTAGTQFDGVPLFPLAETVLFPHAVLPLHIFEGRYRAMVADALAGDRLIAMALPRDAEDDDLAGDPRPAIHPVACIGRIIRHERLPDGRYQLLLEGQYRARLLSERPAGGSQQPKRYRVGRLALLGEKKGMEIDLERQRDRLGKLLMDQAKHDETGQAFRQLLTSPTPTIKIADLMAFHLLDNVRMKQSILSDPSVPRRVGRLIAALQLRWQPLEMSSSLSLN